LVDGGKVIEEEFKDKGIAGLVAKGED